MIKLRVAVLMGGPSSEHEVSLKSGAVILANLDKNKYLATSLVISRAGKWPISLKALKNNFDLVFIAMHGEYGEDGSLQALLEKYRIPFTGSGSAASRLGMDKAASACVFEAAGLLTPPRADGFPAVVKPADRGSSVGADTSSRAAVLT
ncbi:MAG: D-alanine--D-alanine ligase, partial [Nanoarchaeota archaeon]